MQPGLGLRRATTLDDVAGCLGRAGHHDQHSRRPDLPHGQRGRAEHVRGQPCDDDQEPGQRLAADDRQDDLDADGPLARRGCHRWLRIHIGTPLWPKPLHPWSLVIRRPGASDTLVRASM
ncbi:hypothetical protein SDC9_125486 [bioreactor metagenome]|uniref:Uncharacterized protein n=1 Tax=bioreactor metagenome TaxID=1076179 RepID=A0A645CNK9_9ZZZZ